jgi:hypothetical protein
MIIATPDWAGAGVIAAELGVDQVSILLIRG